MPPRMGVLTVEMAAVHCVMAGCKTGLYAGGHCRHGSLLTPEVNLRGAFTTTGTTAALIIVMARSSKKSDWLAVRALQERDAMANATIGYAVNPSFMRRRIQTT